MPKQAALALADKAKALLAESERILAYLRYSAASAKEYNAAAVEFLAAARWEPPATALPGPPLSL